MVLPIIAIQLNTGTRRGTIHTMARKQRSGYWVRGHFVAEGSELDLELKRELKGDQDYSRADAKRDSDARQQLGEDLMGLGANARKALQLPDVLSQALDDAKKIESHGAKRRQIQYIGKLMRKIDQDMAQRIQAAIEAQHQGSAQETQALHQAEVWRDRLVDNDQAVTEWLAEHRDTDVQAFRSLIRQARKDAQPAQPGGAPRHGKPYRDIFQIVRAALRNPGAPAQTGDAHDDTEDEDA
jgi:ribosome-associated protein